MLYHPIKNYLFVHIQKTGGSSIQNFLIENDGAIKISPPHIQINCIEFRDPKPKIFCVIRNPWSRLVSWYEMMRRKDIHNDFSKYLLTSQISTRRVTFSEFIRRIDPIIETYGAENYWNFPCNFLVKNEAKYIKSLALNQLDYVTDQNGKILCDHFIMFKNIETEVLELMKGFSSNFESRSFPRENSAPKVIDYRKHYTDKDVEWVSYLYKKDISYFNFTFDD